jgi:hypothetical protein
MTLRVSRRQINAELRGADGVCISDEQLSSFVEAWGHVPKGRKRPGVID